MRSAERFATHILRSHITTVSGVVHSIGRVLDRHVHAGGVSRVAGVVLVLRIVHLDGMVRSSGVSWPLMTDREIIRWPIVVPDRVCRVIEAIRFTAPAADVATHVRVRGSGGSAGSQVAAVNVHVVVHVWLLVAEVYGKRWAT